MGIMDLLKKLDINKVDINDGVEQYRQTENAVLLDVRNDDEYASGHIPGSQNLDVQSIRKVSRFIEDRDTPFFVYCYSGGRSAQAVSILRKMGYTNVTNIGGIAGYRGEIER